jgi:predicted nucleic acid-binding protein
MHRTEEIVINTGPILSIVAALGDLDILQIYRQVWVPWEVCQEVLAGGPSGFAVSEFQAAQWLKTEASPREIAPLLANSLDPGEAAVVQLALDKDVQAVCIDEAAGRRVARLSGLSVTGSVGVLLRAKREGHSFSMRDAIQRMRQRGVWLSERVVNFALAQSDEESGPVG